MAKRLQRIQVGKRRFGFTYGLTRLGVKEYAQGECECGDLLDTHEVKGDGKCSAPGCECRAFKKPKLLSFAIDRPEIIKRLKR
jgi:hypothetical protein